MPSDKFPDSVREALNRRLIFVSGKGGVGKSVIAQSLAPALARHGKKTLWVTLEDPDAPGGSLTQVGSHLWRLNADPHAAFEEYTALKIGIPGLARVFAQNKLMRYLSEAAPGMHDLVLLGKIWFEREHYDHVIVDMPSTGYSLSMFQSTSNFSRLFSGGPIHHDAVAMLETLGDPKLSTHLVVALPEEMPLREGLELSGHLRQLFPKNPAVFLANRIFPGELPASRPAERTPFAESLSDYLTARKYLEHSNLKIWKDAGHAFAQVDYLPPPTTASPEERQAFIQRMTQHLIERGAV